MAALFSFIVGKLGASRGTGGTSGGSPSTPAATFYIFGF